MYVNLFFCNYGKDFGLHMYIYQQYRAFNRARTGACFFKLCTIKRAINHAYLTGLRGRVVNVEGYKTFGTFWQGFEPPEESFYFVVKVFVVICFKTRTCFVI